MATVHSSTDIELSKSGTSFEPFLSQICRAMDVINNTEVDIKVKREPSNVEFLVKAGSYKKIDGIENANQVSVALLVDADPALIIQATTYA